MTSTYFILGLALQKREFCPKTVNAVHGITVTLCTGKVDFRLHKYILSVEVPNPSGLFIEHSPSHYSEPCVILSEITHEV